MRGVLVIQNWRFFAFLNFRLSTLRSQTGSAVVSFGAARQSGAQAGCRAATEEGRTLDIGLQLLHRQDLVKDFVGCEVAFEAGETTGAKFATVGTANLRRDAERVSVARFAVES